jgi:hypothetical protein
MALIETLFDLLSATAGAILGVLFGFFLNRKSRRKMASQVVLSKQELNKIKLENESLLKRVQDKENMILELQMHILGKDSPKRKSKK